MMPDNKSELLKRKRFHVSEVQRVVGMMIDALRKQARDHDLDKINNILNDVIEPTYDHHQTERHHFLSTKPEEMDLIDLLEMVADSYIAAGSKFHGQETVIPIKDGYRNPLLEGIILNTFNRLFDSYPFLVFKNASELE